MKALRINPFNLKPQVKRLLHKPKHVEIPAAIKPEIQEKLLDMQGSLDYMATRFGLRFEFKNSYKMNHIIFHNRIGTKSVWSEPLQETDSQSEFARKIYEYASKVL